MAISLSSQLKLLKMDGRGCPGNILMRRLNVAVVFAGWAMRRSRRGNADHTFAEGERPRLFRIQR